MHIAKHALRKYHEETIIIERILRQSRHPTVLSHANRLRDCVTGLGRWLHQKPDDIASWYPCRSPVCNTCRWLAKRRHLGRCHGTYRLWRERPDLKGARPYHVILTRENCSAKGLLPAVSELKQGTSRLWQMKPVANVLLGSSQYLHIGLGEYMTYSPHLHVIALFDHTYRGRRYLSQHRWGELFGEAMAMGYVPKVFVHRINVGEEGYPAQADYVNLAGYCGPKPLLLEEIQTCPEGYLKLLEQTLGQHLVTMSHRGIMRELRRAAQLAYDASRDRSDVAMMRPVIEQVELPE